MMGRIYPNKDLEFSISELIDLKNYISSLHKRLALLREDYANKTPYEQNEVAITEYETICKIFRMVEKLHKAEENLSSLTKIFYADVQEVSRHWETVIELAKQKQSDSIALKHLLYNVNWKELNERIDKKIEFYHQLKKHLISIQ